MSRRPHFLVLLTVSAVLVLLVLLSRRPHPGPSFSLSFAPSAIPAKPISPALAKGLHVSGWAAGNDLLFGRILRLAEETEINALVIDIKDETGYLTYASGVELAKTIGANSQGRVRDIGKIIGLCRKNNLYLIGRIVAFRDPLLAEKRPALAVRNKRGGLWRGKKNEAFLDPYSAEVRGYLLALAREAAGLGFDEIQFDYLRFPSDGNTSECRYSHEDGRLPHEVIADFLKSAKETLRPYRVVLSVDIFGQTGLDPEDMGIGQKVEELAAEVDYISPMLYPSHYRKGVYDIPEPEKSPYLVVKKSLASFQERTRGSNCRIRPWLQDFSLRHPYGEQEVREQIRACEEAGIKEWLLWDPYCRFTESALQR